MGYKLPVSVCDALNGTRVQNLAHLAQLVDACTERFLNFDLRGGRTITLDRQEAVLHNPRILQTHAIPSDRSL